jgi:FMN-dependent NADH-azoreductase
VAVTVLGLAGSARRGGNTETLLDWCLEAARGEGADIAKFRLCDLDLRGCRGCEACSEDGTCIQQDDMHLLYPHLREADSIVLAAPVYSMGLPGVPKIVIDRCQPFWALRYVLKQPLERTQGPERLGAFLSCAGTGFADVFEGSRRTIRYLWHVLGITPAGDVVFPKVDARGEILEQIGARSQAEDIGRRLGGMRQGKGAT